MVYEKHCFQDDRLKRLIDYSSVPDWQKIAEHFPNRSDIQCQHRWQKVLSPDLIKGPWTKEVTKCILFKVFTMF